MTELDPIQPWEGYQETEVINGVERSLGSMTLQQLEELELEATERLEAARTDCMIIQDYRERLYPDELAERRIRRRRQQ